jgi:23S rRNA (uracil1939-C5)-methyltransferase
MTPRRAKNGRSPRRTEQGIAAAPAQAAAGARADARLQLVTIEKPIYGGAFLARAEGKAVFVPLTLPGEQARVRIVEEKRSYAAAETEEIVAAARDRISAPCSHFGPCGGCHYQHANYDAQLRFKEAILRETLERAGVSATESIDVLSARPWQYRNRIRLAFDAAGNPGYRERRSHAVVPIHACPIAAPVLVKAALGIAGFFRAFAPHDRPAELALFCDAEEETLIGSIFTSGASCARLAGSLTALLDAIPALRGVEVVEQSAGAPPRIVARAGINSLGYRAAGFEYRVDHGAFFQVNRWLVDSLADHVTAGRSGGLAWDLFAGVGLFARRLAATFDRVVAVESAPAAAAALAQNLAGASGIAETKTALDFLRMRRRAVRSDRAVPELIVVDPPRTGLGAEAASLLAEVAAPAIAYVSCDPATLARDLRALIAAGYAVDRLTLADLFPQTFHIETIADLRLRS